MEKTRKVIVGIISSIYLTLVLLKIDILSNTFIVFTGIVLISQAMDEWNRYKETKRKIYLIIPIALLSIITFSIIFITLTRCLHINMDKTKEYIGEKLSIGIIGDIPEIREVEIEFEIIDFDFLKEEDFDSTYDAIFITKDNFKKASNAEYVSIYKTSEIPFYFIENEKTHVNFIKEDLSYGDEPDAEDGMYITGLFYSKDKVWGYGLYNNTKNETNIRAVYSRIFEDISKIRNGELP
ncbi:hypothetical protein RBU61_17700 [Tissierella sp. MB52-C2]|uniref:hypothetical protein n=1 Tax=Tissierella sp. MB52-C2 TaxID=3070999 RepID=UPI00280BA9EE|nr:hypothetical protein [Tissierella sp. MB52-C2]WMM24736.1 hypothetical protein RBU61_17700 [Tissierella sp. MB52-C2]